MRATSMRRLVGGAASLMLIGTLVLTTAGSAIAAPQPKTTRLLYVGPDPSFSATPGLLTFSPVSVGEQTVSTVYVKNVDNQTLTHVVITFAVQQGGLTITQVIGANAGSCPSDGTTVTCDFGNLAARATRTFSLVLQATAAGSQSLHGKIVFNESNNPQGGNEQISADDGSVDVAGASCDSAATFVLPNTPRTLLPDTGNCAGDGQRSALVVPGSANGNVISVDDAVTATACSSGFSCFGNQVRGNVNDGASVSPYLKWTIFYSNAVLGNISPNKVAFVHDATIILPGNKGLCKNATSVNCQEPYFVGSDGVTFYVRTPTNGLIKGMH